MLRGHVLLRHAVIPPPAASLLHARNAVCTPPHAPSLPRSALAIHRGGPLLPYLSSVIGARASSEKKCLARRRLPKTEDGAASPVNKSKRKRKQKLEHELQAGPDLALSPNVSMAPMIYAKPEIILPPRITLANTKHHNNLHTYMEYVKMKGLSLNSSAVKGACYEYRVQETLWKWFFRLEKVGRTGDGGIDLIGYWCLPNNDHPIKVILQCKASPNGPRMIRELAGSYPGAAAGWGTDTTLAFLVSSAPMTKATREELERCEKPMGFILITPLGELQRMVWNNAADTVGLKDVSVSQRYSRGTALGAVHGGDVKGTAALHWKGRPMATLQTTSSAAVEA